MSEVAASQPLTEAAAGPTKPINVLFVDDESHILKALRRMFHGFESWQYFFANSPKEALEIIAKHDIAVLVSDHRMPQMTGAEFLARVKEKRPNMVRMMLTGQAGLEDVQEAVNAGEIFRFILKPWKDDELKLAVKSAVDFHIVRQENRRLTELTQKQNEELQDVNQQLEEKVARRTTQLTDALHTAQALNTKLTNSLRESGRVFFSFIELTRPTLGSHSRRVAEHVVGLGKKLGLTSSRLSELSIAALLHDIGKVGFPLFMLEKDPTDYGTEELEIYRQHARTGADTLAQLEQFDAICAFIRCHHEHCDGTGFPDGPRAKSVPQESYVIGIIDKYDHLINRVTGDKQFIYQHTYQTILGWSGSRYSENLVEKTLQYIEEINEKSIDENELRIGLSDLRPGMVLTRDTFSMSGLLLLATGSRLTVQAIERIRSIAKVDPIAGEIYVVRSRI